MRKIDYLLIFGLCVVASFGYQMFWWIRVNSASVSMPDLFIPSGTINETNPSVSTNIQASAVSTWSRLGLPVHVEPYGNVWGFHMMFFMTLWSGFFLVVFVDLARHLGI